MDISTTDHLLQAAMYIFANEEEVAVQVCDSGDLKTHIAFITKALMNKYFNWVSHSVWILITIPKSAESLSKCLFNKFSKKKKNQKQPKYHSPIFFNVDISLDSPAWIWL